MEVNIGGSDKMTQVNADPRAVAIAQAVHKRERPQATILFGSRARGDYDDKCSDIDLLLVCEECPDDETRSAASDFARAAIYSIYQREVPLQLEYAPRRFFDSERPYINSVTSQAMLTGVVMADNPEEFTSQYAHQPEGFPRRFNWPEYDEHVAATEDDLAAFSILVENNPIDRAAGYHAQQALERAMKAAIIAHGGTPERDTHNIGALLGTLRRMDPELAGYHFSVDPNIYNQYASGERYRLSSSDRPRLTEVGGYYEDTVQDIRFLLDYTRRVEGRNLPYTEE